MKTAMKTEVYSVGGVKGEELELPVHFVEPVRKDLIKRAVLAVQSTRYQPKGADPYAGTRQGNATPKRRKKFGGTYGHGISRVRRKRLWRRGIRFYWVAAFVSNAVKGRKAFPPKVEKEIIERINRKEKRKAIRSAIAATVVPSFVKERGHDVSKLRKLPVVVEDKFENLKKTKEIMDALYKIGLKSELERCSAKKIRAGRGKMRGRKYIRKIGPVLVLSRECSALRAARNIPGVDVIDVHNLNAEILAPGTQAGRLSVWTKSAIETLDKERLFF